MERNVNLIVNIDVAKKMLQLAGFDVKKDTPDDVVFEKVMSMMTKYGVTYSILS